MPGKPTRTEEHLENWGGTNYQYQYEVGGRTCIVSASSTPTAQQAAALAARGDDAFHLKEARDRVLKGATLISEKAINFQGHPGWELQYRISEGVGRHRQYKINGQVFEVLFASGKQEDVTSKEADAFFQSFQVLKDVSKKK